MYIYVNFSHEPVFSFKDHRLLVIAPHADDEVLGCGGLISRVKQDGGKVFVLIFNVGSIVSKNEKKSSLKVSIKLFFFFFYFF